MANSAVIGLLRVLLHAETAQFESAMKRASSEAKEWTFQLRTIGSQATAIGSNLTRGLTLPIVGVGAAVAKLAIDFESSFAGVRKTVDATDAELDAMAQSFRNLSKTIPLNVNELNRLGEAAGALGIPKAEIVDFARVMGLLGVTTNLTANQAAESIAKIQNIFNAAGKDTDRFAATLVALGNDGASTEAQIVEMASRIAGAGHAINMTQGEVLAFASALSSVGIEAEMGGSAISRVFIDIASAVSQGGDAVAGFARVANMSVAEFSRLFKEDAATAVNAFITGLGQVKQSGGDLLATLEELGFKEIRVRDTLLRTAGAGDLLTKALTLQKRAWQDNTALTDEAAKRFETTAAQLTLLWNRVKDVGITLGTALLPSIKLVAAGVGAMLPLVEALVKVFTMLPPHLQLGAVGMLAVLAAIGPALVVFGQLAMAASTVTAAFTKNGIATKLLSADYAALRTQAGLLTGAVGLLGKALAVVAAGFAGWEIGRFIDQMTGASTVVQTLTERLMGWSTARETTLAQEDTIRLAIQRGAHEFINYAEAIRFNEEWNRKRVESLKASAAETQRTTQATQSLTDKLDAQNAKVAEADRQIAQLSDTARAKLVKAIQSGAFTMQELAEATGLSEMALDRFQDRLQRSEKAATKTAKEVNKLSEEMDRLVSSLSGADAIREAEQLLVALQRLPPVQMLTADAQARINEVMEKALDVYKALGVRAPEAMARIYLATLQLQPTVAGLTRDFQQLGARTWLDTWTSGLPIVAGLGREFQNVGTKVAVSTGLVRDLAAEVRDGLANAFSDIGRVTDGWISSLLSGLGHAMEAIGRLGNLAKATITDKLSAIGSGIGNVLAATGSGSTAQRVLGGAATGAVTGAAASAALGAKIGSAGGWAGMAVGAGIGALVGWWRARSARKAAEKEANQALKQMKADLLQVFGSFEDIERVGKAIGVNLAGMWDVSGTKGLEQFGSAAEEFKDRINGLNEELMGIAERGGVASIELIKFRDAMRDSAEMADFLKRESLSAADGIMQALSASKIQTAAGAQAMGGVIAGAFAELQKQGLSVREILAQLQPAISALQAQLVATGFDGGAAFGYINHLATIAANEISGPALDALNGLTRALQGAHNAGFLTQEMFTGLVGEIMAQREAILGTGVAAETVNALMQRDLQTIWQLQQDFNYQVDDATQKLLDEAEAAGTVGDKYRSAMDRAARAMERVADALERVLGKTGDLKDELDRLPRDIDININQRVNRKGDPDAPPVDPDTYDPTPREPDVRPFSRGGLVEPQYAATGRRIASLVNWRPIGTDTVPAMLTPGEIVLNAAQQRTLADTVTSGVRALELATSNGAPRGDMYVTLDMRGAQVGSMEQAREIGEAFAEKLAQMPIFQRTLGREMRINTHGLGSDVRQTVKV